MDACAAHVGAGEHYGITMSSGDRFLRGPLENFNDGSVLSAHHNRRALRHQAFSAQRRQMISYQLG